MASASTFSWFHELNEIWSILNGIYGKYLNICYSQGS